MTSRLTELGIFLRKLRIDRRELLSDMSVRLAVSMSFLSSVENGKKKMPSEWIVRIPELYNFTDDQKKEFDKVVAESEKGIDVKFAGLSDEKKRMSVAFARKIKTLKPEEQRVLQELLF